MPKKTVVKRVKKVQRVLTPVVAVERKTAKRVRMPSPGDVVNDITIKQKSTLVGVPRTIVAPGSKLQKKKRVA
jgi:hypothetical protein